ncbi:hypothetical protein QZN00_27895 [Burkholderia multivorans]|nr:hypothetical protein [Burkholderia multivorans]
MAWDALTQQITTAGPWGMAADAVARQGARTLEAMLDWSTTVREQHSARMGMLAETLDPRGWQLLLRQYVPIAVTEGCWLQYAFGPLRSHTGSSAALLRAHSLYAGYGSPSANAGRRYLESLSSLGIDLPGAATWAFANDREITTPVWREPAVTLALSEFSGTYLPEILGYNLFRAVYGLCPLVAAAEGFLRERGAATAYWEFHRSDTLRMQLVDAATDTIRAHLAAGASADVERIETGLALAERLTGHWMAVVHSLFVQDGASPRSQMLHLVERKAEHAFGYHHRSRLYGRSVDEYLDPQRLDAAALLEELARSPYVKPGDAERSPLLTKLVQFGGPMFRIFTPAELDTISAWINSLPKSGAWQPDVPGDPVVGASADVPASGVSDAIQPAVKWNSERRYSVRELYYRLLNIDAYPDALESGRRFAAEWLVRSGVGAGDEDRGLPFESYSPDALRAWLDTKHREQVDSYQADGNAMTQSREEVILLASA